MLAMTKTAKASKLDPIWVALIEGARIVARLGGHAPPLPKEVCDEATAKLLEALRLSHIASRGHSEVSERRECISAKDWQSLCADIAKNCLVPRIPSGRRYPRGGFFNVEVSSTDIQRTFGLEAAEAKAKDAAALSDDRIKQLILAEEKKLGHRPPIRMWNDTEEMRHEMSQGGVTKPRFEKLWREIYPDPPKGRRKKA
jgi:hypothetical protein